MWIVYESFNRGSSKGTALVFQNKKKDQNLFVNLKIVDYYQDAGISAKTGNYRPEFERLKAEINTAFDYIPDESNDSVIYTKEPIAISVGVKPVKFCEEKAK